MTYYLMQLCKVISLTITFPLQIMELLGLYKLYKRLFPLLAYNITFSYNDKMHEMKRNLFRSVCKYKNTDGTLRLLEIGCGSGSNFKFYPYGCTVICTDPNPYFEKYLQLSMEESNHLTYERFIVAPGEDLREARDGSVDVVVCTLVLCSVNNTQQVLQESIRILKPGGAFFFLEHVVAEPSSWTYFFQNVFQPMWYYLGDGCMVTKATWRDLETAGFSELHLRHIEAPRVTSIIRPHIIGYAIK